MVICRTKILAVDLTSKQEQIENFQQQLKDQENNLHRKQEELTTAQMKFRDLVKLISSSQNEMQVQRTALNDIRLTVQENHQDILEYHRKVSANMALLYKKFTEEKTLLGDNLRMVSTCTKSAGGTVVRNPNKFIPFNNIIYSWLIIHFKHNIISQSNITWLTTKWQLWKRYMYMIIRLG